MTVTPAPPARESAPPDLRVDGEVVIHRLYDVGYEIDLDGAFASLAGSAPDRPRPVRGEAQAIQISNPPVVVELGTETIPIGDASFDATLSARIFDFGVISLRARVAVPAAQSWEQFTAFGIACSSAAVWRDLFPRLRLGLVERLGGCIARPGESPVTEDYVVYRVFQLADVNGRALAADVLNDAAIAALLIGEPRPLAAGTRRELLSQRFSYFEDDLAVLTWNAALVVEPVRDDADVQYVVEFANAQLLELRYYDSQLDAELPRMYDRILQARSGFRLLGRRYSRLLSALQTRVAEATELIERTENALKVTDDVFLARIYSAALEIFRGKIWRSGVNDKLAIVRDAYSMLNAESQARRSEVLELTIVLLIVFEIVLALFVR